MAEVRRTNCHYCGSCSAFLATVEDGRVPDLVPDTTRYPSDERTACLLYTSRCV